MLLDEMPVSFLDVIKIVIKLVSLSFFSFVFSLFYLFIPTFLFIGVFLFFLYRWVSLFFSALKILRLFQKNA